MPSRLARPRTLSDMLLYRLNRIRAVGGGMVLRYCEGQFGVTRREWVMLALLNTQGPVSSSELAERAELDKSATSKAVTALLQKGLLERTSRTGDRRFAQLVLTPAGQALYDRILPIVESINRELLATLDPPEVEQLDRLLERVQQRADALRLDSPELPRADRRHGGSRTTR